ncbi:conserved hypothetical protein [Solidesulfovibrio fructosivorans JJ]]|uniref:Uncharacterized protein n=1 Tax=Solidesulfovibrio fructosivorans JJ] TaxID=596151 RepID=E1JS72_SOLFR|nr:hypothetical protein [Solidesulfovibrio fructosivorans]EFL52841.1 conserved hypothetical protein [Solidesulfovibrio fructosivorans JJ]]
MEESLLREILAVQKEILAEVRLMRQALVPRLAATGQRRSAPAATPQPKPVPETTAPIPPAPEAAPQTTAQQPQPAQPAGSMLTLDELTDLGGQFLEPGQLSRGPKVAPVEAADLLRDIKAKNRAKRGAFAEFEKFGRGR